MVCIGINFGDGVYIFQSMLVVGGVLAKYSAHIAKSQKL